MLTGVFLLRFSRRPASPDAHPADRVSDEKAGLESAAAAWPGASAETVAQTVAFLVVAGTSMLDSDYSVGQIRDTLEDLARANHLPDPEVIALPTALIVSANDGTGVATAVVSGGSRPLLLHQIEDLNSLITAARGGHVGATTGLDRIELVRAAANPFTLNQRLLGSVAMSCGLATLLGATAWDLTAAALLGPWSRSCGY